MTPLVIIGTGGHGREALDLVEAINTREREFEFLGFIDEHDGNEALIAARGARIVGALNDVRQLDTSYVVGVGSGDVRRRIDEQLTAWGLVAATLVHPSCTVGSAVSLAPGVIVAAGARLTTNVTLGRHTHINVCASVSHDCQLGDYVTVSPGVTISGTVQLRDGVMMGAGSTVIQNVTVGAWTTVGAGGVVIDDLPGGVTAVGVPARPLG
jgi:sugar O-acyltransferase (sialic acid O-acetyltransferase NeuD family)